MTVVFDIETTGLNPFTDVILTIQMKMCSTVVVWKVWELGETEMITRFLRVIETIPNSETILGYNNLKFDLPFIVGRLMVLGKMSKDIYTLLYNKKWLDLYQVLGDEYRSMNLWLRKFGITRNLKLRGKDVPLLFEKRRFEEIEQHAIEDLLVCERLFEELKKQMPILRLS